MKKLIFFNIGFVMLCAGAASALDVDAHLTLEGNLANGGDGTATRFIELDRQDQKNKDAFIFNLNGEKAGGSMSMIWTFTGDDPDDTSSTSGAASNSADVTIRRANVWFKPTEWAKITVGTFFQHLYFDQMRWWQDVYGNKIGFKKWMNYREGSGVDSDVSGAGIALELKPFEALTIELAAAPGTSDENDDTSGAFFNWDGDGEDSYLAWGATAKYKIGDNASVGVAYADNGTDKYKLLSAGFDVGHPFRSPYYVFVMPRFYFGDRHNSEIGYGGYIRNADVSDFALTGIAIDNMFKFRLNEKATLQARLPLVIRMTDEKDDPSYLIWDIQLDYKMGDMTPYIEINNGSRIYAPLMFGSEDGYTVKDSFAMDIRPGVKFNFGKACEVFTGVDVYFGPGLKNRASGTSSFYSTGVTNVGWRVPFGVTLSL
ncbi:hypothetical protein [Treponema sp.]|uniref:hypothetical protein n=1 Tax=Treponema sp. TaxID=166 RepID=UPI00388E9299